MLLIRIRHVSYSIGDVEGEGVLGRCCQRHARLRDTGEGFAVIYTHTHTHIYIYIHIHIFMFINVYINMHVYRYTYT